MGLNLFICLLIKIQSKTRSYVGGKSSFDFFRGNWQVVYNPLQLDQNLIFYKDYGHARRIITRNRET